MRYHFYYDRVESTMSAYQKLKEITEEPLVVRAGTQLSGIGRADHIWLSPPGGLWLTFDIKLASSIPSFALYAGFCLHKCLEQTFSPLRDKLAIKWTNDLMYGPQKLGGILCRFQPRNSTYQVGVGLNTNNSIDPLLGKFGAVALKDILGFEVDNEYLCNLIVRTVDENLAHTSSTLGYITYCNDHLFGKGRIAEMEMGGLRVQAEILGIDPSGALLIRKEMGELVTVHTGSILTFLD